MAKRAGSRKPPRPYLPPKGHHMKSAPIAAGDIVVSPVHFPAWPHVVVRTIDTAHGAIAQVRAPNDHPWWIAVKQLDRAPMQVPA